MPNSRHHADDVGAAARPPTAASLGQPNRDEADHAGAASSQNIRSQIEVRWAASPRIEPSQQHAQKLPDTGADAGAAADEKEGLEEAD